MFKSKKHFPGFLKRMSTPTKSSTGPQTSSKLSQGWIIGIVIIVILLLVGCGCWCTYTESGKTAFANIRSKFGSASPDIRDLSIVMFMNPTCPWCQKMLNVLKQEGQLSNITVGLNPKEMPWPSNSVQTNNLYQALSAEP